MIDPLKITNMVHSKGIVTSSNSGYSLNIWDFVKPCLKENCPIVHYCWYWNGGNNQRLKNCKVENTYLRNQLKVFMPIIEANGDDPFVIQAVGDFMIPLYHDLCKILMEIIAYEGSMLYDEKSGKKGVLPLYKEKRDTIITILKVWKESGLKDVAQKLGYVLPPGKMKGGMSSLPGVRRFSGGAIPGSKKKREEAEEFGFGDGGMDGVDFERGDGSYVDDMQRCAARGEESPAAGLSSGDSDNKDKDKKNGDTGKKPDAAENKKDEFADI